MRYIKEYNIYEKLRIIFHMQPRDVEEILKEIPSEEVVPKVEYTRVLNENAKLTDCVQDLLKDQDVLKQLLEKEREKNEKIFEEIDNIAYKNGEGDLFIDLADFNELKTKYKGETK